MAPVRQLPLGTVLPLADKARLGVMLCYEDMVPSAAASLVDNSANLDGQNGGFTVFGRVLGSGLALFDAIAAELPRYDIRATFNNAALDTTPLLGIPNPVPADFQLSAGNFLHFPVVERVGELVLTVSSSDPALVAPSFLTGSQGPQLQLDLSSGRAGTAVVTLRIASIFDPQDFVEDPFTVVITAPPSPPSDILLSAAAVAENLPPETVVGGSRRSIPTSAGATPTRWWPARGMPTTPRSRSWATSCGRPRGSTSRPRVPPPSASAAQTKGGSRPRRSLRSRSPTWPPSRS